MPSHYGLRRAFIDAKPSNSFKIQIAYVDTRERHVKGKVAADDTYRYQDLRWMDMPMRFVNYAQANVYAVQNYSPILYRLRGSNDEPNYQVFESYANVKPPVSTPQLEQYLTTMRKAQRGRGHA